MYVKRGSGTAGNTTRHLPSRDDTYGLTYIGIGCNIFDVTRYRYRGIND